MSIDEIRKKQIQEILNEDRNINLQVIELQQKALAKYEGNNAPLTTGDRQTIQNSEVATERLLGLLQQKLTLLATVPENVASFERLHGIETLQKITNNDEILAGYNGMVRVMTDSASSPLLRQNLKNSFAQLESSVGLIEQKLFQLTATLGGQARQYNTNLANRRNVEEDRAINEVDFSLNKVERMGVVIKQIIPMLLSNLAIFRIMKKQIFDDNYMVISRPMISAEEARLVQAIPVLRGQAQFFDIGNDGGGDEDDGGGGDDDWGDWGEREARTIQTAPTAFPSGNGGDGGDGSQPPNFFFRPNPIPPFSQPPQNAGDDDEPLPPPNDPPEPPQPPQQPLPRGTPNDAPLQHQQPLQPPPPPQQPLPRGTPDPNSDIPPPDDENPPDNPPDGNAGAVAIRQPNPPLVIPQPPPQNENPQLQHIDNPPDQMTWAQYAGGLASQGGASFMLFLRAVMGGTGLTMEAVYEIFSFIWHYLSTPTGAALLNQAFEDADFRGSLTAGMVGSAVIWPAIFAITRKLFLKMQPLPLSPPGERYHPLNDPEYVQEIELHRQILKFRIEQRDDDIRRGVHLPDSTYGIVRNSKGQWRLDPRYEEAEAELSSHPHQYHLPVDFSDGASLSQGQALLEQEMESVPPESTGYYYCILLVVILLLGYFLRAYLKQRNITVWDLIKELASWITNRGRRPAQAQGRTYRVGNRDQIRIALPNRRNPEPDTPEDRQAQQNSGSSSSSAAPKAKSQPAPQPPPPHIIEVSSSEDEKPQPKAKAKAKVPPVPFPSREPTQSTVPTTPRINTTSRLNTVIENLPNQAIIESKLLAIVANYQDKPTRIHHYLEYFQSIMASIQAQVQKINKDWGDVFFQQLMKSQTNLKEELDKAWGSNARKNLHTIEIVRWFVKKMQHVRKFLEDLERENGAGKPRKGGRKPRTKKQLTT